MWLFPAGRNGVIVRVKLPRVLLPGCFVLILSGCPPMPLNLGGDYVWIEPDIPSEAAHIRHREMA